MAHAMLDTLEKAHVFTDDAKDKLHTSRLIPGAFSSDAYVLHHTNDGLHALMHNPVNVITYTTGEITSAGSLACQACGCKMRFKKLDIFHLAQNAVALYFIKDFIKATKKVQGVSWYIITIDLPVIP